MKNLSNAARNAIYHEIGHAIADCLDSSKHINQIGKRLNSMGYGLEMMFKFKVAFHKMKVKEKKLPKLMLSKADKKFLAAMKILPSKGQKNAVTRSAKSTGSRRRSKNSNIVGRNKTMRRMSKKG